MKRPANPALSQFNMDFFPLEKWISFLCWIGFPATWHSHQSGYWALMRRAKIKCCKLGLSQPAPYLGPVWEEFYVQLQIRRFSPLCHVTPATTPHWYTIPQPPKSQNLHFWPVSWGFYDNSRGLIIFISKLCFHFNLVRFNGYTAIQSQDLVSKCGPTSGFHSSLGSYFLYRDVIAATKTDLQSHSIQTGSASSARSSTRLVHIVKVTICYIYTATSWWCWFAIWFEYWRYILLDSPWMSWKYNTFFT